MIIAIGEVETKKLIDDLILIAQGRNDLHEKNPDFGKYKHSDGWGIAYLEGKDWKVYKSTEPIYDDVNVQNFGSLKSKCIVLHVRKATKGCKSIHNTQPLHFNAGGGDYLFTHNGNIDDEIELV